MPGLLDQAQLSAANLAVHVFLARSLPQEEYGAFAICFALFLLIGSVHNALVAEPMLVFGCGGDPLRFRGYLRDVLAAHWATTSALGVLLFLAGLVLLHLGVAQVGRALLPLAAAQPFILLFWLARRACYARLRPRAAALGSSLYLLVLLLGLVTLAQAGLLGVGSALGAMGIAGLLAGWLACRLLREATTPRAPRGVRRAIVARHWDYGRWILATSLTAWVPFNIFYLLLPGAAGLGAVAALRAMENLVTPMLRVIAPATLLLIPALARHRSRARASFPVHGVAAGLATASCIYWLALILLHRPIVELVYGGRYADASYLLLALGALPVLEALGGVWRAALKALERPALVFRSFLLAAAPGVALGVLLLPSLGPLGAAIGVLVFSAISAASAAYLLSNLSVATIRRGSCSASTGRSSVLSTGSHP